MNHVVVVDGLVPRTGSTPERWFDSQGQAWPTVSFQRDFPLVQVTAFRYKAEPTKSIWDEVQKGSAGALVEKLDTLHDIENALSISRSDRWKFKSSKANTALVFFGTPLTYDNQNNFRKLLRACATVELGLPTKADNPTTQDIERLTNLIKMAEDNEFQVTCIHEQQKTLYSGRAAPSFLIGSNSKFVVGPQHMKIKGAEALPVDQDHLNCASWNATVYNRISMLLRDNLRRSTNTLARIDPTTTNKATEQVSVNVKLRPDRRPRPSLPIQQRTSRDVPMLPPHRLDFPENEYFVGRRGILDVIADKLVTKNPAKEQPRRAFALYAPPGYGKTQVARQFAKENMGHFKSILWIFADSEYKVLEGYAAHAVYLGLTEKSELPNWANEAKDALWNWYRETDLPWLVIFDNAIDQNMINFWWPHGPTGSILITTNDPVFSSNNVAGDGAELAELDNDSGVTMVLSQITQFAQGQDKNQAELEALELVSRFGGLPLAIQTAVGSINESSRTLAQWNRRASTEVILKSTNQFNFNYAPYPKGLAEAFANRVENLDDSSRALLDVLSTLDPDGIPEQLIDQESPAEDVSDINFVSDLDNCISRLSKGLVLRGGRSGRGDVLQSDIEDASSFHMHRLLRDFVRIQMTDESRQVAFETASRLLSLAVDIRNYPQDAGLRSAKSETRLCYRAGYFEIGLENVRTGVEILQQVERRVLSFVGGADAREIGNLRELHYSRGCIETEMGDFQSALESFSEYKRQYDSSGVIDKRTAWKSLGGVANAHQGLGNHDEAITYYQQSFQFQTTRVHSPYEVNICRSYWAQGRHGIASERLEELLRLRLEKLGPEPGSGGYHDFIYGHMNYILGNVRISQGRIDEAFGSHQIALACWRKVMGENHHKTGDAWHKSGWHLCRQGKLEESRIHLKQALKVYGAGLHQGFRRAEISRTTYKLGLVEAQMEDHAESQRLIKDAEAIRKSLQGESGDKSATEATYDNLVTLWSR
ncbi:hypothetical protein EKO27_g5578 [Xylaria grammica]|uniref:DUF7779 domain-containing protein n=1 Tax=Xylaria grammica TaxID=363999 RepID=A0A439D531_9PEZI|nr:hypothetical protein EKO27_g5578 [Xylaria grammica]